MINTKIFAKKNGYRQPNIKTFGKNTINVLDRISEKFNFELEKNKLKRVLTDGKFKVTRGFNLHLNVTKGQNVTLANVTKVENEPKNAEIDIDFDDNIPF
jgi:hypothetical protein